jgi:hypothetical protein
MATFPFPKTVSFRKQKEKSPPHILNLVFTTTTRVIRTSALPTTFRAVILLIHSSHTMIAHSIAFPNLSPVVFLYAKR